MNRSHYRSETGALTNFKSNTMTKKDQTIVVFTDRQFWGKSETLPKALELANFRGDERLNVFLINANKEEVEVNELGGFSRPTEAEVFQLTNDFEPIEVDKFVFFNQQVGEIDDAGEFDRYFKDEHFDEIEFFHDHLKERSEK